MNCCVNRSGGFALQRAQDFMFRLNFPALASYPAAAAAVLVCAAVFRLKIYQGPSATANVASERVPLWWPTVNAEMRLESFYPCCDT